MKRTAKCITQILLGMVTYTSVVAAPVDDWSTTKELRAPEAFQAAAVDKQHIYAIASTSVAKYDRRSGERIDVSTGDAKHLNSGFLWKEKLLCAHSNYPLIPEQSEIKVLDPVSMKLSTFHNFGDFGGSLVWVIRHEDHWWCNFARYGDRNSETFLVRFDDQWKECGRWTYPEQVVDRLGQYSLSGGLWLGNELLATGHTKPELYRLRLPAEGNVLEFVERQSVPFTGQGIALDPVTGELVGISRVDRKVIFAKETSNRLSDIEMPVRGICAHRGASQTHPENTLAAFREAIRLGVQMIEFDVAFSKDGHLVLMHDRTVDRTTDGEGPLSSLTLAEIKELDAGSWKDQHFRGEKIPTLAEALAIMPDNVWLNIHLKGDERLAEAVAHEVVNNKRLHQSFLACDQESANAAKRVDHRIKICNMERQANSLNYVNETIAMGSDFIQLFGGTQVDPEHTRELRRRKVRINFCCANEANLVTELFIAGVEFPLVDKVEDMLKAADQQGIERLKPIYLREAK